MPELPSPELHPSDFSVNPPSSEGIRRVLGKRLDRLRGQQNIRKSNAPQRSSVHMDPLLLRTFNITYTNQPPSAKESLGSQRLTPRGDIDMARQQESIREHRATKLQDMNMEDWKTTCCSHEYHRKFVKQLIGETARAQDAFIQNARATNHSRSIPRLERRASSIKSKLRLLAAKTDLTYEYRREGEDPYLPCLAAVSDLRAYEV